MAFYSKRYFLRVIVYVLALFVTVQESTAINSKSCKGFFSPDREDLHLNILDNLTNFHSSLKSRLNKEGINFKYPEIKIEFEVLLKNEEIAKKFGRKLDTLRSKGYPYEKCLIQIFDILFNIDKANDPKILKQAYEVVYQERYIKFSNSVRRVLEKGYFFYPSFREVNIYEINQMLIAGVLPLGLTLTSVNADGMTYSPTTFLTHDSSTHTSQMRNEVSYTPSRWENAKIFLEKDKKRSERQFYSDQILFFTLFHEKNMTLEEVMTLPFWKMSSDDIRSAFSYYISTNEFDSNSPYKLNKKDFLDSAKEILRLLNK